MRSQARLRNFGIMAHVDAGKTTVSERMLYLTGRIHRMGEVHHGTSTLDHTAVEREHGITVSSAAITAAWNDHQLNIVDTPGHVDFGAEVERSLRVVDGAIAVFDAVAGVEPQSEAVWHQADRHGVARLAFVNKLDRAGADLGRCTAEIGEVLGARPLIVQHPLVVDEHLIGLVDLIDQRLLQWSNDDPRSLVVGLVPEDHRERVDEARSLLVEAVADLDEQLLRAYLAGPVGHHDLRAALRRVTVAAAGVPVLAGSALRGIGVQPLLDAVVDWLPSPLDVGPAAGTSLTDHGARVEREADPDGPVAALVFKVAHPDSKKLAWLRVYSGTLRRGDTVANPTAGCAERISRLVQLDAGSTVDVEQLRAGDIGGAVGLRRAATGHTLCAPEAPVVLEAMDFADPVLTMAIEPCRNDDQNRLSIALGRLSDEDPTFAVRTDPETGQTLIAGMGELHLQVLVERLSSDHRVEVRVGEPKVAYRETITRAVAGVTHRLKKQTGGPGMFAEVTIDIEPTGGRATGHLEFVDATTGGVVPPAFAKAMADGATEALSVGPLGGDPLVGVRLTLTDGATHAKDSSERAFRIAGAQVLGLAAAQAAPVRLEPVTAVNISTPDDCVGPVMGLIGARRGEVVEVGDSGGRAAIATTIPLAELFGFTDALRSASQGRASASYSPAGYQPG